MIPHRPLLCRLAAVVVLLSPAWSGRAGSYTPIERLQPARLKATHEDVTRLKGARTPVPPLPGLHDYRAILHAHAEDSAHTGGTRPEMLADAKRAGVSAILLTDHYRPPRDFINDSWRGLREGVLFIPGSEARGFLLYPMASVASKMDQPVPEFIGTVTEGGGLIFLSHIEERKDHPVTGLTGMEIYNRHFDVIKDKVGVLSLILKLTDPASVAELSKSLEAYPDEVLAFQVSYPTEYLAKFDRETAARPLTGVAANDCHHNQVLIVKVVDESTVRVGTNVDRDDQMRPVNASLRPGVKELTRGHKPGDIVVRLDFDPYHRAFHNSSTHVLAPELTERAIRDALRAGHAYVSHDWVCDPTGFRFGLRRKGDAGSDERIIMGDECAFTEGDALVARFPAPCTIRLKSAGKTVAEATGDRAEFPVTAPGVYRLEAWQTLDGEDRPWIYSNPVYVRPAPG